MNNSSANILKSFIRLARMVHRESHKHVHDVQDHRMHRAQGHLLSIIAENNGAKQMELAELMDMRPSSMTEMLTKLAQTELIERKQDEKDQRVMRVYLTEKGENALKASKAAIVDMSDSLFGVLTEEEQAQFASLMDKLTKNLEEKCGGLSHHEDFMGHRGHGEHRRADFGHDFGHCRHHRHHNFRGI
ncbi:MarR family winged helix-turn-helix transcriptional regulator [Seleniivibrio woodruffii]|uniref:MarR family winged helix-turn-helix transcriptional regulator n=1 Tax=Seleniivibrio woodruffii TaxID=1078050 RepID=UPI0039E2ADE0